VSRQDFYKRQQTNRHLDRGKSQRPGDNGKKIPFSQRNLPLILKKGTSNRKTLSGNNLQKPTGSQAATFSQEIPMSNRLLNGGCFMAFAALETGGILLWVKGAKGKAEFSHQLEVANASNESQAPALVGIKNSQEQIFIGAFTTILISVLLAYTAKYLFFPEKGDFTRAMNKIRHFFRYVNADYSTLMREKLRNLREKGIAPLELKKAVDEKRKMETSG
jgi:hypothetical protein